uniref:Mo25-like protein n=1 Tax=Hypericum perforatum TaxID=65561 RepID=D9ZHD5_HYPPE|nr:Mo25-like protein [Hypericum perforatum]
MKGLFKNKPKTPVELVQCVRELLLFVRNDAETRERKREEKMAELSKLILEMRTVLFGNGQSEPSPDACSQLTQEFFTSDTLRLLIACVPKLELGVHDGLLARINATHVIANLQRQRVSGRLIASEYLEKNLDIMDILLPSYEEGDLALTYGAISRECLRHQVVARYVLNNENHVKKAFGYIQLPNFDIASDAQATFRELMTRHKSTVVEFVSENYDWEYNTQLLESPNYLTRRYAVKLLADMLLDRSNSRVMVRYVSSLDNLRILMNLFRVLFSIVLSHTRQFVSYILFVANQNKPPEVVSILVKNKNKLLGFLDGLTTEKEDEQFEADKLQVINEISSLEIGDRPDPDSSEPCQDES